VSDVFWKSVGDRILLVEIAEYLAEQAVVGLFRLHPGNRTPCHTADAEPGLVQFARFLVKRRVETREVERPVASVATEQVATAAARRAKVVVFGKLKTLAQVFFWGKREKGVERVMGSRSVRDTWVSEGLCDGCAAQALRKAERRESSALSRTLSYLFVGIIPDWAGPACATRARHVALACEILLGRTAGVHRG